MMRVSYDPSFQRLRLLRALLLLMTVAVIVTACDRMITPPHAQLVKDADEKAAQGDYLNAIGLYESALDGTAQSADIHYKLGLLYDDKMNDAVNALHHFKRYLVLHPNGGQATEVRDFIKRDETAILTSLSGDSVVSRAEASRLRNDNLTLRKQIEERAVKGKTSEDKAPGHKITSEKATPVHAGGQSYEVQKGDTLFSISRKFYKSSSRWKEIRDANKGKIESGSRLKPGVTLTIP
jgi:LysM repeat protein